MGHFFCFCFAGRGCTYSKIQRFMDSKIQGFGFYGFPLSGRRRSAGEIERCAIFFAGYAAV
jgi:hypothetical protein